MNLKRKQLKLPAVLTLAVVAAVAAMTIALSGGAQAQSPDNNYDDPQPCGPGADTAFQPEPHEITSGHFALFDAYWERTGSQRQDEDGPAQLPSANTGWLHTNACPPLVTQTMETDINGDTTTVTTLSESNIDIDVAIFHVLDEHKATVATRAVDGDYDASLLYLDQYRRATEYVDPGDQVWWLRLDDPRTTEQDETSGLVLGFSTVRFDGKYWAKRRDTHPLRYKFELERNPGIAPDEHPHFLAYKARADADANSQATLVWDSARADTNDMAMEAGELEDLQWIFTQPGTYEISVHLLGWVRDEDNAPPRAGDWEPISGNFTETSEVKRYVIQVGSELDEVEPPQFGVSLTVDVGAAANAPVGAPIPVFADKADDLAYTLSGEGAEDFYADSTTPGAVQIKVADSVTLDHNRQARYFLTLGVTDKVDHESNHDISIDDTIAVEIVLTGYPRAVLEVDNPNPVVGETVTVTAVVTNFGEGHDVSYIFRDSQAITSSADPVFTIQRDSPTTERVRFEAAYETPGDSSDTPVIHRLHAAVTITWSSQ